MTRDHRANSASCARSPALFCASTPTLLFVPALLCKEEGALRDAIWLKPATEALRRRLPGLPVWMCDCVRACVLCARVCAYMCMCIVIPALSVSKSKKACLCVDLYTGDVVLRVDMCTRVCMCMLGLWLGHTLAVMLKAHM